MRRIRGPRPWSAKSTAKSMAGRSCAPLLILLAGVATLLPIGAHTPGVSASSLAGEEDPSLFLQGGDLTQEGQEGEDIPAPRILIHSPEEGSEVSGDVSIQWEVLFFDPSDGFVDVYVNGEKIDVPMLYDIRDELVVEPEVTLSASYGTNRALEDGRHQVTATLFSLRGERLCSASTSFTVANSSVRLLSFNYTSEGHLQAQSAEWPLPGECNSMRPIEGFDSPESFGVRPFIVYVAPECLGWLKWQPEKASTCGDGSCLWVDHMPCVQYADAMLTSCHRELPSGFAKWPHQVWGHFCMETDIRRNHMPRNVAPYIDVIANYRLDGKHAAIAINSISPVHVTITYTPGNQAMWSEPVESDRGGREFAAMLVSNCGATRYVCCKTDDDDDNDAIRDIYAARLLQALGKERLHVYGRCFKNREFPLGERLHGSPTLALLRKYKFTIAFENTWSKDYVSERFYQPLLAGSIPVYMGAPNIADFSPGDDSFIDVRAFASPEALADHLTVLGGDESEGGYRRHLNWREGGVSEAFRGLMAKSMTRSSVYGEGIQHNATHRVDLTRLHGALCAAARDRRGRTELQCAPVDSSRASPEGECVLGDSGVCA